MNQTGLSKKQPKNALIKEKTDFNLASFFFIFHGPQKALRLPYLTNAYIMLKNVTLLNLYLLVFIKNRKQQQYMPQFVVV